MISVSDSSPPLLTKPRGAPLTTHLVSTPSISAADLDTAEPRACLPNLETLFCMEEGERSWKTCRNSASETLGGNFARVVAPGIIPRLSPPLDPGSEV